MFFVLIKLLLFLIDCSLESDFWSRKKESSALKCEAAAVPKKKRKETLILQKNRRYKVAKMLPLGKIIHCKSKKV